VNTLLSVGGLSKSFGAVVAADAASFDIASGEAVGILGPNSAQRCKAGIARSFQVPQPFGGMTVFENTLVGATHGAGLRGKAAGAHTLEVLDELGLLEKANVLSGSLTLLERKRLELARALAAKPSLLLLDEIAGGLTDAECDVIIQTIKRVHQSGTTIVWIEHIVHALLAVVERLIVVNFGKIIADGHPDAIMASDEVKSVYLGVEAND